MLLLVFFVLFAISIVMLMVTAALIALQIVLWIIVTVSGVLLWMRKKKVEPEQVEDTPVHGQVEAAFTFTQNKDGTWVLR